MAFDFPASPSEGQIFNAPGGPTYVFNTPVWKAVGQGQIAIISDTPPASPANGALWYESDTGILFIWYNDGNSSQWVQVGGIQAGAPVPPAADNAEYVMVNGVWRLKSQSFDLTGKTEQDITVPAWGPQKARLLGALTNASGSVTLRISTDGTTFLTGATDYVTGGFYHLTGTSAFQNIPGTAGNTFGLTPTSDNAFIGLFFDANITLASTLTGGRVSYQSRGNCHHSTASNLWSDAFMSGYTNVLVGPLALKALRVSFASATSGKLNVEWLP